MDAPDYLTVAELARLLRVKERKVYALASEGALPVSRATGKLLFPRAAVEAWIARHSTAPAAPAAPVPEPARAATVADPPAVIVGSHDPLLDWAIRESGSGIATFLDGSGDGLARFEEGGAIATGLHLAGADAESANLAAVAARFADRPVVLLEWARRQRGLLLAPNADAALTGPADLAGRRVVPRQPGSGARGWQDALLMAAGVAPEAVRAACPPVRSETDLAEAVAFGKGEAGFGLAASARAYNLRFVPLTEERFDLLIWRRAYFEPPLRALFSFTRTPAFARRATELDGYDISGLGTVRFNGRA